MSKSRLATEWLTSSEAEGWRCARVTCLESDQSKPCSRALLLVQAIDGDLSDLPIEGAPEAKR